MASFRFDTDHLPLVIVTLPPELTDHDQDEIFSRWEAIIGRGQRFAAITDARALRSMGTAKQRARTADWTKQIDPKLGKVSLGHTTVLSNPIARGAMTAISWLHKPSVAQSYVGTMIEAVDWCIERLERGAVPVSAEITALRATLAKESA